MARAFRWFLLVLLLVALVAGAGAAWAYSRLRASLPVLDGTHRLAGLAAPVALTRDALGIPTVRGGSRADVARATGFLHAQDRYFQMDLARRRAAGELAALVGARALPLDREIRIHRFRAEASRAVGMMQPAQRAVLDAYTAGVNSGLRALAAAPFEYLVLRQEPQPWRAEDSLLVVLSMFITLQDGDGRYETTVGTMRELLPPAMAAFLDPPGSEWDAPIAGERFAVPPIPGSDAYNPRETRRGRPAPGLPGGTPMEPTRVSDADASPEAAIGSNSFAVAGSLSADGGALLANDMHLAVRVPNTWYRAAFEWPGHRLIGVTLPGVPALVAGSNTHVAWGFTNSYGDWSDVILLETDAGTPGQYRTPAGWRAFDRFEERLDVAGGEPARQTVLWTIWGPVIDPDFRGRTRAIRWVAHDAAALAVNLLPLEEARTLGEALDSVNGIGTPGQNLVVADTSGAIGWTLYGSIPRRRGLDGRTPTSWADGARGWDGWLDPPSYPRLVNPPHGRLWTANARVVGGPMLELLGDGGYDIGARATRIRERLFTRERFTARDLLAIQLDTRAVFLERWRALLLRALTPQVAAGHPARGELRDLVTRGWSGEADADSAAYRLTRAFRDAVTDRVVAFVLADCYEADPSFDYRAVRRRDAAIYRLAEERPLHLLDARYAGWDALFIEAMDEAIDRTMGDAEGGLADRVWAEVNVAGYRHPLSPALPFVGRWLDMPRDDLPGDLFTPRVHFGTAAASERMVVSPGREADGILHMPTGQSGHPLSPFYANSHPDWVRGAPTPFLPGAPVHTLTLEP